MKVEVTFLKARWDGSGVTAIEHDIAIKDLAPNNLSDMALRLSQFGFYHEGRAIMPGAILSIKEVE